MHLKIKQIGYFCGKIYPMIVLGYVLGLVIGTCLGMMGAGGAILTIPVLTYLFGISPGISTTYSLFIVGITALIGTFGYIRNGLFSFKALVFFGLPSMASVYLSSAFLLPSVPKIIGTVAGMEVSKDLLIMVLFSVLMILSAIVMIRSSRAIRKDEYAETRRFRYGLILLIGSAVGMVTAFLGAGGGFLIIPALVILGNLPMKKAVGTSLMLITINSLLGFVSKSNSIEIVVDWHFLLLFSSLTIAGILTGVWASRYVSGERLKFYFGYFVLVLGFIVLGQEIFIKT